MTLPEALTPSDCDLRGLSYMPLDVQRLRDSDLAITTTGEEFKAAVLLWCSSWSQVPAASLPDDDRLLAALCRTDARAWRRVRVAALRGWVKCKDGRLYHPVVAEKAREAWKERGEYRAKREKDRDRLAAWRAAQKAAETSTETGGETRFETQGETLYETLPEEKGTGSEGIQDTPNPQGGDGRAEFEDAWLAYPEDGRATVSQETTWKAWLVALESVDAKALLAAVVAYAASDYAKRGGRSKRFDRWLTVGAYGAFVAPAGSDVPTWPGPPEVRAAVAAAIGEPKTRAYLDHCGWRDIPDRAVTTASITIAKVLTAEVGGALAVIGVRILHEKADAA